jgi:hypothetical protein
MALNLVPMWVVRRMHYYLNRVVQEMHWINDVPVQGMHYLTKQKLA